MQTDALFLCFYLFADGFQHVRVHNGYQRISAKFVANTFCNSIVKPRESFYSYAHLERLKVHFLRQLGAGARLNYGRLAAGNPNLKLKWSLHVLECLPR